MGVEWRLHQFPGLTGNRVFVKFVVDLSVNIAPEEIKFFLEQRTDVTVDVERVIEGVDVGPLLGCSVKDE